MHNPDTTYASKPEDLTTHLSPEVSVIHPMASASMAGTSSTAPVVGMVTGPWMEAPDPPDLRTPPKGRQYPLMWMRSPQHGEARRKLKASRKRGRKGRNR